MYEIWSDLVKPCLPEAFSSFRLVMLSMNLTLWLLLLELACAYLSWYSGCLLNSLIRLVGSKWFDYVAPFDCIPSSTAAEFSRLVGSVLGKDKCF